MALRNHPQNKQNDETDDDVEIKLFVAVPFCQALGKGKGHGHSHDKKKKRHDQIPEPESFPWHMLKLTLDEFRSGAVEYLVKIPKYPRPSHNPEHIKSPKRIQRF